MGRVGNQIPTQSVVIPYEKSYGDEARQLYDMSGNTCLEWQALMLNDIMAINVCDVLKNAGVERSN